MKSDDPIFRDDLFATTDGWTPFHADARVTQRYRVEPGKAMYVESRLLVHAPVEAVLAKLLGEWHWWKNGRYCNRAEHADGTITYEHYPFMYIVHVNCRMYPPLPLEGAGYRIRIEISHYMTGTLYMDVRPRGDGGSEIYSRFSGVKVTSIFRFLPYPGHIAAGIHLLTERGEWFWPRGTGFGGLIAELEAAPLSG